MKLRNTPLASGLATSSFNGLHPQSKALAAKARVRAILRKLHAANRAEAVAAGFERWFLKID